MPVPALRASPLGLRPPTPLLTPPCTLCLPAPPCHHSPATELAAYTTEHPVYRHINMRMQVRAGQRDLMQAAVLPLLPQAVRLLCTHEEL